MVKRTCVSRLELVEQRRGIDFVSHGHRLHKAFDFLVLHHELLVGGHHRNDLALASDGWRQSGGGCRQKALMELGVHIGQHVPALVFCQDRFKGRHDRLAGFERLDLPALADAPEEVRIPVTGGPVKVVGQVSRGMRQALGDRPCALAVGPVAHQAVGLEELLAAGDRRRIVPAGTAGVGIFRRGCFPPGVLVGPSVVCPCSPAVFPCGAFWSCLCLPGRSSA